MIILCADDYALTEGISRAIGELAAAQRLSATSVLVTSAHWPAGAPRLLRAPRPPQRRAAPESDARGPARADAAAGAARHVSGGCAASSRGPCCGLLDGDEIRAEIGRQLDRFELACGFPPDHIDGHQHVHVLSGVRQALLRDRAAALSEPACR